MEELPPVVDDSQAVRVPIGGDADVAAVFQHEVLQAYQSLAVGGGKPPAEQGVPPLVNHVHVAPGGDKDGLQGGLGHAVHGVQDHSQPPGTDGVHVHRPDDGVNVGVHGVNDLDLPGADPFFIGDRGNLRPFQGGGLLFDAGGGQLIRVPAPLDKDLDAVVQGGIVAGRYRHAIGQLIIFHGKHDQRRRSLPLHHHAENARPRHDLGGPVGGLLGEEPSAVAD